MTAEQFRCRREALGLSRSDFAALLSLEAADIVKCEITIPVVVQPFVRALAMAYVELVMSAKSINADSHAVAALLGHPGDRNRTVRMQIGRAESGEARAEAR